MLGTVSLAAVIAAISLFHNVIKISLVYGE